MDASVCDSCASSAREMNAGGSRWKSEVNLTLFLCQITDLLDVVLDSFIKTSATGGLGSIKAEVMADTAVALASGNVKLVSSKVSSLFAFISFCKIISTYLLM